MNQMATEKIVGTDWEGDTLVDFHETDERVRTAPAEPGDHDTFSHYVEKDKLVDAMVFGTPLRALCGKMWVPSKDALKYPVCPECKEIYESLEDDLSG